MARKLPDLDQDFPCPDDTIEDKTRRLLRLANNKLSDTAFIRSTVGWIAVYQKEICEELLRMKSQPQKGEQ